MYKAVNFKILGMHWPRLIGAFVVIIALIMFFSSVQMLRETSSAIAELPKCLSRIEVSSDDCRAAVKDATGISVAKSQSKLSAGQMFSALARPVSEILVWIVVLILGLVLYRSGRLAAPIVEIPKRGRKAARKRRK